MTAAEARRRTDQHYTTKVHDIQEKILDRSQLGDSEADITENLKHMCDKDINKLVRELQRNGFEVFVDVGVAKVKW